MASTNPDPTCDVLTPVGGIIAPLFWGRVTGLTRGVWAANVLKAPAAQWGCNSDCVWALLPGYQLPGDDPQAVLCASPFVCAQDNYGEDLASNDGKPDQVASRTQICL